MVSEKIVPHRVSGRISNCAPLPTPAGAGAKGKERYWNGNKNRTNFIFLHLCTFHCFTVSGNRAWEFKKIRRKVKSNRQRFATHRWERSNSGGDRKQRGRERESKVQITTANIHRTRVKSVPRCRVGYKLKIKITSRVFRTIPAVDEKKNKIKTTPGNPFPVTLLKQMQQRKPASGNEKRRERERKRKKAREKKHPEGNQKRKTEKGPPNHSSRCHRIFYKMKSYSQENSPAPKKTGGGNANISLRPLRGCLNHLFSNFAFVFCFHRPRPRVRAQRAKDDWLCGKRRQPPKGPKGRWKMGLTFE